MNKMMLTSPVEISASSRIAALLAVGAFGLFIIGVAGFAHLDIVHNAAHDYRHSMAFPCH